MERIKDALNEARTERERKLATAAGDDGIVRRLRLFAPFAELDDDARRKVLDAGDIVELRAGQAVCTAGERDDHVHFLLEGALQIQTADGASRTLHAGEGPARQALDEAGVKTASIVAAYDARAFRIGAERLNAVLAAAAAKSAPSSIFTETFSGQQLAQLVSALRTEHRGLNGIAADPRGEDAAPADLIGERTLGVDIDLSAPDLDSTRGPIAVHDDARDDVTPTLPADDLTRMTRTFEAELRRYVDTVRTEERTRTTAKLKAYATKLKLQAEAQLRAKLKTMSSRYEATHAARQQDLRKRYDQLLALATRLTKQKAEINQARVQIDDKLKRVEQLHREFAELGGRVTTQLDEIDLMLPGDDSEVPKLWAEGGE